MKRAYIILRGILVTILALAAAVYVIVLTALSIPSVQNAIKSRAEKELSVLLATNVSIGSVDISPFNEVMIHDIAVPTPDGQAAITASDIGCGIDLWHLIRTGKVRFNYAELIGLNARIWQPEDGAPLNIQFLIDALSPKDKKKPPTKYDLQFRSVILRKCTLSYDRLWVPDAPAGRFSPAHIRVENLRADIELPSIRNDRYDIDIRRLAFYETSGVEIKNLTCHALLTPTELSARGIKLTMPRSSLTISDISIPLNGLKSIGSSVTGAYYDLKIADSYVTPHDLRAFYPPLDGLESRCLIDVSASGTISDITIHRFSLRSADGSLSARFNGVLSGLRSKTDFSAYLTGLAIEGSPYALAKILAPDKDLSRIAPLGAMTLSGDASATFSGASFTGIISSAAGKASIDATAATASGRINVKGDVFTPGFNLAALVPETKVGEVAGHISADLTISGKIPAGTARVSLDHITYAGRKYSGLTADVSNDGNTINANASIDDSALSFEATATASIAGSASFLKASADIRHIVPSALGIGAGLPSGSGIRGKVIADIAGNTPDSASGFVEIADAVLSVPGRRSLPLHHAQLDLSGDTSGGRTIRLTSDYAEASVTGNYSLKSIAATCGNILTSALPSLFPGRAYNPHHSPDDYAALSVFIPKNNRLLEFFNLPVRLLQDVEFTGNIDSSTGKLMLKSDIPYLQQGRDKLIKGTHLLITADFNRQGRESVRLGFETEVPSKGKYIRLRLDSKAEADSVTSNLAWRVLRQGAFGGNVRMNTALSRRDRSVAADVRLLPSQFEINDTLWQISPARISYASKNLAIDGVNIGNGRQSVTINGSSGESASDSICLDLKDIDLDYVFDTLNINYVTFGGKASGKFYAKQIFSRAPILYTPSLSVESLSYNDAVLGDATIRSWFDTSEKKVAILADIAEGTKSRTKVNGGVWVTRDSLAFGFDTRNVNVKFLQPFMSAFASDVRGRASGSVRLFGTFHDIDLTGRAVADSMSMKIDYTNTTYHVEGDTVLLLPGKIVLDGITVRDRYDHTARLDGAVTHRYFHDPTFNFTVRNIDRMLCYDTNAAINPLWYGRVFCNGQLRLTGVPGKVSVDVDATTAPGTQFTYVISDSEEAADYRFLTFTDKRRQALEASGAIDTVPDIEKMFRRNIQMQNDAPSDFDLNLRIKVNPDALLTIIMDPVAGDKIRCTGNGNLQIGYSYPSDAMTVYGRYILDKGSYNFSLQDLILKDFTIRQGSSIAFNGNPLDATLNIDALYRVNTNLSDLDKSFATDRDLNRTNVPVDAVLRVTGDMTSPDISFDIQLPTLTSDVERKVKSIISTEDMMSRQIIYLLALNRFYTPEYMGASGNNNELASVASSTISSQLTNMLAQLTDKLTLAPNFRTDKGDFSDIEVDLALSSALLNNRLLLNGNFGYRDRTTSNTTFIGDFDIEYLLNRSGNLRLKAYNHYNDQNYYLKQALTTQGVGIVYKHDFDRWFSFLRKKQKKQKKTDKAKAKPKP